MTMRLTLTNSSEVYRMCYVHNEVYTGSVNCLYMASNDRKLPAAEQSPRSFSLKWGDSATAAPLPFRLGTLPYVGAVP